VSDHEGSAPEAGFDAAVPNVARIYDYFLGGKDNFQADRDAAEQLRKVLPEAEAACAENRGFLRRAVRYLAGEASISQFIDIGSGLPTAENTHQVAGEIRPDARVVYVDHDPVVAAHARALLGKSPGVAVLEADVRRPGLILDSRAVADVVDFSRPVAILLIAVLHFIADDDDPYGIVTTLKSVMAPGSYLVISHVTQDRVSPEEHESGLLVYQKASAPVVPRRYEEVLRFFDGTELADPGLVSVSNWRPVVHPPGVSFSNWHSPGRARTLIYGGVACKRLPVTANAAPERDIAPLPAGQRHERSRL
jgi:S-adenosyl methyltransferase